MAQAQIDQAVFASDNNSRMRGYQLIARSPGIDDQVAHELCRWSPSHGGLLCSEPDSFGLSFFSINENAIAVGRSAYGTPEYSGRGGLQIVTTFLVTTRDHLAGFNCDAWSLLLMARSMGHLRFDPAQGSQLPKISLADRWSIGAAILPADAQNEMGQSAIDLLRENRRVAVLGLRDPIPTLRWIICKLSRDERMATSFATELQPSSQRPYRIQFLSQADLKLRAELSNNRIAVVKTTDKNVAV